MTKYISRVKSMIVCPEGEPIFSERCTEVSIEDEAGGEFIMVHQNGAIRDANEIAINPEEWKELRTTIEWMVMRCRKDADDEALPELAAP